MSASSGFAVVTPASRGLGFAFARQLLARTDLPVVATARRDGEGLRRSLMEGLDASRNPDKRLRVFEVDVTGMLLPSLRSYFVLTFQMNRRYPQWRLKFERRTPTHLYALQ